MTILIRRAHIHSPGAPQDGTIQDILIRNGIIEQIATDISASADQEIASDGLHVSPGWVDIFCECGEPGMEHRETLETAAAAAAAGGFTHLFVLPNTRPVVHDRSLVEYIRNRQVSAPVTLHPIGAVTRNTEGRELAEMYDMHAGGAVAFSDGTHPVQSPGILIKALQYVKAFDGLLIQVPDDRSVAPNGLMHEGVVSTRMGLLGKPALAEELIIARDIKLTRYAGSRLHFTGVSLPKSLEYISRAKAGGTDITCSVTPQHLFFTDADIEGYDTNLKMNPPLRPESDRQALLQAVLDGTVDCISSHHAPRDRDHKECEFAYAEPGMSGLESVFRVLCTLDIPLHRILETICFNPRKIFKLPAGSITEGAPADITIFSPSGQHLFSKADIRSRSANNPFLGRELKGRVLGVVKNTGYYRG